MSEQGFARVNLKLVNPDADLETSERERIESALGLPVRVIWRHMWLDLGRPRIDVRTHLRGAWFDRRAAARQLSMRWIGCCIEVRSH